MAEPFELIDEYELLLYSLFYEALERQRKAVLAGEALAVAYWEKEATLMLASIAPAIQEIVHAGGMFAISGLGIEDTAPLFENEAFYARSKTYELIRGINETTQQNVAEIIEQSVIEGWDIDTTTEALSEWFNDVRARRIAVTETTNAYGGGAQMTLDELRGQGKDAVLVWLTANDDRVCEICGPRHLKEQGDGWTEAAAAHPGCRCDWKVRVR